MNEKAQESRVSKVFGNFCEKTTFSPIDLTFALRFVNFTGYTGQINFPNDALIRSGNRIYVERDILILCFEAKSYFLYNVINITYEAVLVGTLNETTVTINDTAIQFVNNEIPTSGNNQQ